MDLNCTQSSKIRALRAFYVFQCRSQNRGENTFDFHFLVKNSLSVNKVLILLQATESLLLCLPDDFPTLIHAEKLVFALSTSILYYLYKLDINDRDDFIFGIFR